MDERESRHGKPQPWQQADNGGLQPADPGARYATPAATPAGLKPMTPLRPMPPIPPRGTPAQERPAAQPQPQPTPAWLPDAQPQPTPVWQHGAPQLAPYPARQNATRPDANVQQPAPVAAWQPAGQPNAQNWPSRNAGYEPAAYPQQPPVYPGQTAAYPQQPPVYPGQTAAYPQQPPVYSGQTAAYPQQPPTAYPAPASAQAGGAPPARRVWTQTFRQTPPVPETGFPPPSGASAPPPAPYIPAAEQPPVLVRRERAPEAVAETWTQAENAPMAHEGVRRRRADAREHRESEPATVAQTSAEPAWALDADVPQYANTPDFNAFEDTFPAQDRVSGDRMAADPGVNASPEPSDDDSGRYEAVHQHTLAEPVPVPTYGATAPGKARARRKRHPLRAALILLLALATVAFALYQSGLGFSLLQPLFGFGANGKDSVPSVFGNGPSAGVTDTQTIAPATQVTAPELRSVTVNPATAKAPATLTFSLETNAATSAILLLTEANTTLHATANGTPKDDGLLWRVTADLPDPYKGKVRVFLRDQAGAWSEGELTCTVDVQ